MEEEDADVRTKETDPMHHHTAAQDRSDLTTVHDTRRSDELRRLPRLTTMSDTHTHIHLKIDVCGSTPSRGLDGVKGEPSLALEV